MARCNFLCVVSLFDGVVPFVSVREGYQMTCVVSVDSAGRESTILIASEMDLVVVIDVDENKEEEKGK